MTEPTIDEWKAEAARLRNDLDLIADRLHSRLDLCDRLREENINLAFTIKRLCYATRDHEKSADLREKAMTFAERVWPSSPLRCEKT